MNDVVKFLQDNPVQYLATVGRDGKAKCRPFMFSGELDGKLWFCTNNTKDVFKDMQAKVGCDYISDLPSYKRKVWHEMKRLNPADYEERQLEDFSKYVFGMSYQTLKDVMKQQKGREKQCRKQGCWWKRKEQLAKKQYHTGLNCR